MPKFATSNLLKNQKQIYEASQTPSAWPKIIAEFIIASLISLALFGLVLATHKFSWPHAWELGWKTIVLLGGPIFICLPSLYVFASVRGSSLKLLPLVYLAIGTLATSGIVLLALTPITWFFTWTSNGLDFIRLLNAAAIGLGLIFGLFFLGKGILAIHKTQKAAYPESRAALDILLLWFILLIIVTVQMSHKLGPWYH